MDPVAFFREERWTAGVIGLGYVRLPLSATIVDRGLRPLDRVRQPDFSHIDAAGDTVAKVARPGQLVVLESTTYPGVTDEVVVPAETFTFDTRGVYRRLGLDRPDVVAL